MSTPRFFVDTALRPGAEMDLPPNAARHVQVLRLQPGAEVALFDGHGGQWQGEVLRMGRAAVQVRVGAHQRIECELRGEITIALGMPANERMDGLIEKATELGVTAIQPLVCERSVLRVAGDRAQRKAAHWHAIAVAACEQCGRNRVPQVAPPARLREWLARELLATASPKSATTARLLLSLGAAPPLSGVDCNQPAVCVLSGPEGGLSADEEEAARSAGFVARSLGARVLRADTAPLAALAWIALNNP